MIEILSPGLQTTIQDLGRPGYMHLGISHSGAMDELSCLVANRILGMADNAPVLECSQVGPTIKFLQPMNFVIVGAHMQFQLDGLTVSQQTKTKAKRNSILTFQSNHSSCRAYIAFNQIMDIKPVLGSTATHVAAKIGGYQGRALQTGDRIAFIPTETSIESSNIAALNYSGRYQLRYCQTPESGLFTTEQLADFHKHPYQITKNHNRMGIRTTGHSIKFNKYPSINSKGLLPGAVQIPPDGQPIIAAKDAQCTGGYLRIGQIIRADLPIIGQLQSNDEVTFLPISAIEAQDIFQKQRALIRAK